MSLYKKEIAAVPPLPFPNIQRGRSWDKKPHQYACAVERMDLKRSGEVLIVDVFTWQHKEHVLRFVSDGKGFLTTEAPFDNMTQRNVDKLINIYSCDEDPGAVKAVENFLHTHMHLSNVMSIVNWFIRDLASERRVKAAYARDDLRKSHFRKYPALPENLGDYCDTNVFDNNYLFISKIQKHGKRDGHCSCCGKKFRVDKSAKHNAEGTCPKCGANVIYKGTWFKNAITDAAKICIADKSADNELLLRWVNVTRAFAAPGYKRTYHFDTYAYNLYLKPGKVYFYKWIPVPYGYGDYYWYRGHLGDQCYDSSYIYTDNLDQVFGSRYYNVNLKAGLQGKKSYLCFISLLNNLKINPAAEYLFKMGMPRLASTVDPAAEGQKPGFLELMRIRKEYAQVYAEVDVSYAEHTIIRCAKSWCSADLIRRFRKLQIPTDKYHLPGGLMEHMSFEKMVNYFSKQAKITKRTAAFCMEQWNDYIFMCKVQNIDLHSKSVRFPKNIVESHDTLSKQIKAIKVAEMDEAYLRSATVSYEMLGVKPYSKGKYAIVPSYSATELVAEGNALGHCVGNGCYAERVINGTCLILFVRRSDAPDVPYATLEYSVSNRMIRQLYARGNRAVEPACRKFVEAYLKKLNVQSIMEEKTA